MVNNFVQERVVTKRKLDQECPSCPFRRSSLTSDAATLTRLRIQPCSKLSTVSSLRRSTEVLVTTFGDTWHDYEAQHTTIIDTLERGINSDVTLVGKNIKTSALTQREFALGYDASSAICVSRRRHFSLIMIAQTRDLGINRRLAPLCST